MTVAAPERSKVAGARGYKIDILVFRCDLLGFLVRALGLELVLEGDYQFDRVERVSAEVIDK